MPFQPDQMSPDTLRRLVKAQRRALAEVLGQQVPQHQAQEIVAQTLGYASWHEALIRVGRPPEPEPTPVSEAPRLIPTPIPPARLDAPALFPLEDLVLNHEPQPHTPPPSLKTMPQLMIQGVLNWLVDDVTRWNRLTMENRTDLIQRVALDPATLAQARDVFLERAWQKPELFIQAVSLIPGEQLWPWLHRAARAHRRDLMDAIHGAHDRAIGSEPYHALHNAVYARDHVHVERLIADQCRRYGLDTDDVGGTQQGPKRLRRSP
jgi:hypothetical protein